MSHFEFFTVMGFGGRPEPRLRSVPSQRGL
jgi:hypothetical protein